MSKQARWRTVPIISFFAAEWQLWRKEQTKPCYGLVSIADDDSGLLPYPVDMAALLALPHGTLDNAGVPYNASTGLYPAAYHPTTIAQYGLANWNAYLVTKDERHRQALMKQARWLAAHQVLLAGDAGGWPMPFSVSDYNASAPWLSALTQGNAVSVLVRAYRLTHEEVFLQVARRAMRTFELDIRDGGVSTSIGEDGVFFEEFAVYPASHVLNGYILALFGLYDYADLTGDTRVAALIRRSLATLHILIERYDTGYWSRYDLFYTLPASRFYHALHITLLEALAQYSGCAHCAALAARWAGYKYRPSYHIAGRLARGRRKLRRVGIRGVFFGKSRAEGQTARGSVRAPLTAPPVARLGSADREIRG